MLLLEQAINNSSSATYSYTHTTASKQHPTNRLPLDRKIYRTNKKPTLCASRARSRLKILSVTMGTCCPAARQHRLYLTLCEISLITSCAGFVATLAIIFCSASTHTHTHNNAHSTQYIDNNFAVVDRRRRRCLNCIGCFFRPIAVYVICNVYYVLRIRKKNEDQHPYVYGDSELAAASDASDAFCSLASHLAYSVSVPGSLPLPSILPSGLSLLPSSPPSGSLLFFHRTIPLRYVVALLVARYQIECLLVAFSFTLLSQQYNVLDAFSVCLCVLCSFGWFYYIPNGNFPHGFDGKRH